jgi:hypothetical protein
VYLSKSTAINVFPAPVARTAIVFRVFARSIALSDTLEDPACLAAGLWKNQLSCGYLGLIGNFDFLVAGNSTISEECVEASFLNQSALRGTLSER